MSLLMVDKGKNIPHEVNVVIEIPMNGAPVKYEVDKKSGALWVDRFMMTAMFYPANYGYIPETLSEDGDPVDVLVVTPVPLMSGVVIRARVVGLLRMTDESGPDAKLIAVPVSKLSKAYDHIQSHEDLPVSFLKSIEHFFKHYKDLEEGKWVKVEGWDGVSAAHQEILASAERFQACEA